MTTKQRTAIRRLAGVRRYDSRPIVIVDGNAAPHVTGHSYYHTTPSGKTIVRHPAAYRWPTQYHCSTRRVEVGADWIKEHLT